MGRFVSKIVLIVFSSCVLAMNGCTNAGTNDGGSVTDGSMDGGPDSGIGDGGLDGGEDADGGIDGGQCTIGIDCPVEEMMDIPAGSFMMGCNIDTDDECLTDENPYHFVSVPMFKIDKFEVTAGNYKKCVEAGVCTAAKTGGFCNFDLSGMENHPINCVDWYQSAKYCMWARKHLPSEAEWEKAARSSDGRKYPWGNTGLDCEHAMQNATSCGNNGTATVGSNPKGVSPYGVMDMIGNVWEWVEDDYHLDYTDAPQNGSAWICTPERCNYRVLRGGSWMDYYTYYLRASSRLVSDPSYYNGLAGFRCSRR